MKAKHPQGYSFGPEGIRDHRRAGAEYSELDVDRARREVATEERIA